MHANQFCLFVCVCVCLGVCVCAVRCTLISEDVVSVGIRQEKNTLFSFHVSSNGQVSHVAAHLIQGLLVASVKVSKEWEKVKAILIGIRMS